VLPVQVGRQDLSLPSFTSLPAVETHPVVTLVSTTRWRARRTPDVALLEREVDRLRRHCDRLICLNPLLGSPGYEPLTRGIRAILPRVDDFLPIHNLESLEQLGAVLARLD